MLQTITNLYKKPDVFRCVHDVHRHFKSEISPFHVLKDKMCYPHGCLYFQWKCKLLAKHKKCFRKFTQTGKECFNCRYFFEEKIHQYPEILLGEEEIKHFFEQFELFEEWIEKLKNKRVSCEGIVSSIKPDFILYQNNSRFTPQLKGFLIRFDEGFIDNQQFNDPFFLSISSITQNKLLFREEDSIEFEANLKIDKGRFKFIKSGKFQFFNRGTDKPVRKSDILTALKIFTSQSGQPKKCMNCQHGILADIVTNKPGPRRIVVCLKGVNDFNFCPYTVEISENDNIDQCAQIRPNPVRCHQAL